MKKILVPLSALAMLALVACGGTSSSSSPAQSSQPEASSSAQQSSSQEQVVTQISNKEELTAEWRIADADRSVELNLTPKCNITQAIADGTLVIASSNAEIISVLGRQIHAAGVGSATITVTYKGVSDSVTIEVKEKLTNKIKYGIDHEGTLEDPLTNTDALKVGLWAKENGNTPSEMYVKGTVDTFYHAPGSRDDGAVSFYLKEVVAGEGKFEVYKCFHDDGSPITDDEIWKGAEIVAHGIITYYKDGNQAEFTASVLDSVTGEKPADPINIDATVAQALVVGKALSDGDSTWDFYTVTGFVVKKSGSNYFLADTKTVPETTDDKDLYELFSVPSDDQGKLLNGAKVTVKAKLKNYHGQVENGTSMIITVVEEGEPWGVAYIEKKASEALTIAKALADGKTSAELYKITGVIVAITEEYSSFGNMSFTIADTADATETLTVFRMKVSAGKAAALTVGKTVVIGGNLQNYVKNETHTYEVTNGTLFSIKDAEGKSIPTYGTKEAPLSVADLLGDDGTICEQTNGKFSAEQVVVKGVLISAAYSDSYKTWTLVLADKKGNKDTIKCTGVKLAESVAATVSINDTVVVKHFLEFFNGGYSLYYTKTDNVYNYGDILARTIGTSTLTADPDNEHSTINGLKESYQNDETASFTVAAEEGYEIASVEVYGKAVNPAEGTYSVKVAGDGKIKVKVKEAGAESASTVTDFTAKSASNNSYTSEWTYDNLTLCGAANNNGAWAYVKFGPKSATISAENYKGTFAKTGQIEHAVTSVTVSLGGAETYKKDSESAKIKVECYSDSGFATLVSASEFVDVPAVANGSTGSVSVSGNWAAGSYYKLVFDIHNTTTYNGVVAATAITFEA